MTPVFVDSSAVIRAVLERGMSRSVEKTLASATALVVSRLALVETSRALLRAHAEEGVDDDALARAETDVDDFWSRCDIWEISRAVCDEAARIGPALALRSLDAIHLATFLVARKRLPSLRLLTTDARMFDAAKQLRFRVVKA